MSDNRKVLVAKRKNERTRNPNFSDTSRNPPEPKRGLKRVNDTPKKNLANDRLKRLRTSLNEEVKNPKSPVVNTPAPNVKFDRTKNVVRKRPPNTAVQEVAKKLPKQEVHLKTNVQNASSFVFKEEFLTQKSVFTTVTPNPFATSNLTQEPVNSMEEMEWTPTDDDLSISASNLNDSSHGSIKNNFYIVVDTNVFLSQMQVIRDIIAMDVRGTMKPLIFIPWIVTEELDFIKGDSNKCSLRHKAQDAIKYIEKTLSSKHERLKGQTLIEASEQKSVGKSQDNKIIACCFQVLEKCKNMVLLTNDINLKNKAHLNNIPVCSPNEILSKIQLASNGTRSEIILNKVTNLCNVVINECAKNSYGEASKRMPICQPPIKSIQECISTFTKYWFPVFQEFLMKQFKNAVDDLSNFLSKHKNIPDGSKELDELLRLCVRICLFLKDVECCKNIIEDTIRDLNNIKDL